MRSFRAKSWFIFLAAAPLLAACFTAYSQNVSHHWGFSTLHNRYTFTINFGRLWIHCSPPAKHAPAEAQAWEELKRLRNDDLDLTVVNINGAFFAVPRFRPGSVGSELQQLQGTSDQPFLRALDSPNKFVAAEVLLDARSGPPGGALIIDSPTGLPLLNFRHPVHKGGWPNGSSRDIPLSEMTIVVGNLDKYRNFWHEKLDRTILLLNLWWIVAITVSPVLAVTARHLQRVRRSRAGRCIRCGYDLRASTGVCPECGSPIPKNASAPSTV